jgi:ABC-type lipoprotein release transport system permease subunit
VFISKSCICFKRGRNVKPLSILNYYRNNMKRLLAVFLAVTLSVFLLYTLQMLIFSSFRTQYLVNVEPQKHFSSLLYKDKRIAPELTKSIRNQERVEKVIPWVMYYTYITYAFGETGTRILSLNAGDMDTVMSTTGLKLIEGRLPKPGTEEIALHKFVAKNKGLDIGDSIGSDVDGKEVFRGAHVIVGIVDGPGILSFNSLESWCNTYGYDPYRYGLIVIPKKGGLSELNQYIDSLPYQGLDVRTLNSVTVEQEEANQSVKTILTLINMIVITIVSLCSGFLCYIYFYQRRAEFGLLNAIGYTRQRIINRAFAEVSGINMIGFLVGAFLGLLCAFVLDILVFTPKGQLLVVWDLQYLLQTFCIPLFVTLFSIIPIWRMLKRLDPIAILEGEG